MMVKSMSVLMIMKKGNCSYLNSNHSLMANTMILWMLMLMLIIIYPNMLTIKLVQQVNVKGNMIGDVHDEFY